MKLHLAGISVFVLVILVSVHAHRSFNRESYAVNDVKITVETEHVARTVDEHFLSYCIDSYVFQPDVQWLKFNFSSPMLQTLLKALAPALMRIGGSPADWLFFDKPLNILNATKLKPTAIVMTKQDITNLVHLTLETNNRLLFDLNLQLRYGYQWDPSNAIELFDFISQMGFGGNIDWELGNEPSYLAPGLITPENIANDFVILKRLLGMYPSMANSSIVGPDIVDLGSTGQKFLESVANSSGKFLKAITFHHYYFRGDVATYKDYLNPNNFENLANAINNIKTALKHTKYPNLPMWIGETSDAWHSGTANVSDRFVSGFLWLDKLGLSAQLGVGVVMRQTLYGHDYAMLDINMQPNPDYWLSWLHRSLVGQKVFNVKYDLSSRASSRTTRVYAHCTKPGPLYRADAVTAFALNIDPVNASSLAFQNELAKQEIDVYLLQPDVDSESDLPILSKWTKLNGKRLQMLSDTLMPSLVPIKFPPGSKILLPPLTMGFFVFPMAQIPACSK